MQKHLVTAALLLSCLNAGFASTLEYDAEDDWIVCTGGGHYNNRPLYINNTNAFVLTGDKPLLRLCKDETLYGEVAFSVVSPRLAKSVCEFGHIKSMYKAGVMKWICSDTAFPGAVVEIEVLPLRQGLGAMVRISSKGLGRDCTVECSDAGKRTYPGERLSWNFDVMGHPELLAWGPRQTSGDGRGLSLRPNATTCLSLVMSQGRDLEIALSDRTEFEKAVKANAGKYGRLKVRTPDPYLDALAASSVASVDGTWYPPVFVHGALQWNNRLPAWRTIFGGTVYGWHDRVKEEARFYIPSQVVKSDKREAKADPKLLLTAQHPDSRFYGVGRLMLDQDFYDMQSQFFDQMVEEYRWTNDPDFVALLRPALELHLLWMKECFDPDNDGLYESYINTWPTDSQWYNGGGSAEETSYAYRANMAALDMALAAGDSEAADRHREELERIREGFFSRLWLKGRGHSGAYLEQGGHRRVHTDPWLYSIFLPIDAALTSPLQSLESLYYPEWALQNDTMPSGGRRVWTSNWVPAAWSVRELWPGDNYHLAQCCFMAGLADEGWDIMRGNFMHTAYNHHVPANLGSDQGGVDFGDCVHTFARALVSGLFGYHPDYPNGRVSIKPSLPTDWSHASLHVPDYGLEYRDADGVATYSVTLKRAAEMHLCLPISCGRVDRVTCNGRKADFTVTPLPGRSCVDITIPATDKAKVKISYTSPCPVSPPVSIKGEKGERLTVLADGEVLAVNDPQHALDELHCEGREAGFVLADNPGHHLAVALIRRGDCRRWQLLKIETTDSAAAAREAWLNMEGETLQGDWQAIDIVQQLNADVRGIYKQQYLSPRPATVSVRIGTDGFSPWTFPYWGTRAPQIGLEGVAGMLDGDMLLTPQGVAFRWEAGERNIAFTSLWDNFPEFAAFPVGRSGEAIALLVCGSTNMMQCNIENARITIRYADGQADSIPLVPPANYWNLCPIDSHASAPGQFSRSYYNSPQDRFCMPAILPRTVALGENCIAMLLPRRLRRGVMVESVELRCMSQEVVVGLMGISIR